MAVSVTAEDVTKSFGTTPVLRGVSFTVRAGELFFLLGPSGCGKTTLLRAIAGFSIPDAGRIRFDDRDVTALPPEQRQVGLVFQNYALWPHLSVFENVAFGLRVRRVSRDERRRRVEGALAAVRMSDFASRRPAQLSGGQQQRVAVARALVIEPGILLLDEPLSNLDAKLRVEMRDEIRRLCRELGLTAIYVTHDQEEAMALADRMAVLEGGKLLQVGTPEEVYRRPASAWVAGFVGDTNVLPAKLIRQAEREVTFLTPVGELRATMNSQVGLLADCIVAIRPEAIQIAKRSAGGNGLSAVVTQRSYLGGASALTLATNGHRLNVRCIERRDTAFASGEHVSFWIEPDDVVVLSK